MAREGTLFDTPEDWCKNPVRAFSGFVATERFVELGRYRVHVRPDGTPREVKRLGKRSVTWYKVMFEKFARWMAGNELTVLTVTPDDLMRFLDAKDDAGQRVLNSEIRGRYLRMLERVYKHLDLGINPAGKAAHMLSKVPGGQGKDLAKVQLTKEEEARFIAALPEVAPRAPGETTRAWSRRRDRAMSAPGEPARAWCRRRDRAMILLMLGAGLTVAEVIDLYIDNIGVQQPDGSVPVQVWAPPDNEGFEHMTRLRPEYAQDVLSWLSERQSMRGVTGRRLFPATSKGNAIHPATLYRQVSACFVRAGLPVPREGGRTLRNTFAQREHEAGTSTEQLGEYLGLIEKRSVERYVVAEGQRPNNGPGPVRAPSEGALEGRTAV